MFLLVIGECGGGVKIWIATSFSVRFLAEVDKVGGKKNPWFGLTSIMDGLLGDLAFNFLNFFLFQILAAMLLFAEVKPAPAPQPLGFLPLKK